MDATSGTDVALGWAIIAALSLGAFFGIPFLLARLAGSIAASAEQDRLRREAIEEELDERLREEMFAWAEEEDRKARSAPAAEGTPPPPHSS